MGNSIKSFFVIANFALVVAGCQTPMIFSKEDVVNKTDHNFLRGAGVDEKTNPHKDQKCQVCHVAPNDILTKENALETEVVQRKQMKTDLIDLCVECHKASLENEHRVGVAAKLNKDSLPLDHEGKITCATTCHDVHAKDPSLMKNLLRRHPNALCLSCHNV